MVAFVTVSLEVEKSSTISPLSSDFTSQLIPLLPSEKEVKTPSSVPVPITVIPSISISVTAMFIFSVTNGSSSFSPFISLILSP